jgi:hypothetical protein
MADDIDKAIDQNLEETFRPAPDRKMYGKMYQNVPFGAFVGGTGLAPYDPAAQAPPQNADYITTQDGLEQQMLMWRLRQLLSN